MDYSIFPAGAQLFSHRRGCMDKFSEIFPKTGLISGNRVIISFGGA
jgi:hypothetical protein